MKLVNNTAFEAKYSGATTKSGHNAIVIVIKGTWDFPEAGSKKCKLSSKQAPLIDSDQYLNENYHLTDREYDYSPVKPRCDVLVRGFAHSPDKKGVTECIVGLGIEGKMSKQFRVLGNRYWEKRLGGIGLSKPEPFIKQAIDYSRAFGGVDVSKGEDKASLYDFNHAGCGYCVGDKSSLIGQIAPNTEELDSPITSPSGDYKPQSFGVIGRGWVPRRSLAGTYDQHWIDNVSPFLPEDFNDLFFQCVAEDQQIDYLQGGERVILHNLSPEGLLDFDLPEQQVTLSIKNSFGELKEVFPTADTLELDTENRKVTIVWRTLNILERGKPDINTIIVGKPSAGWLRARAKGKSYRSLKSLSRFS